MLKTFFIVMLSLLCFGANAEDNWITKEVVDAIDDSKVMTAKVYAGNGYALLNKEYLKFECKDDNIKAYVEWGEFIGRDEVVVTFRANNNSAVDLKMFTMNSLSRTYFYSAEGAIVSAMVLSKMTMRLTPPGEDSPITLIFDTSGGLNALWPLIGACHKQDFIRKVIKEVNE